MDWYERGKAREDLEAIITQAYRSQGLGRIVLFLRISVTGAQFGLWSWFGALKLMWFGCFLNTSVQL